MSSVNKSIAANTQMKTNNEYPGYILGKIITQNLNVHTKIRLRSNIKVLIEHKINNCSDISM